MAAAAATLGAASAAAAPPVAPAAAPPLVEDTVIAVTSVPTRVLRAAATAPYGPAVQCIIVPGNPGDPELYRDLVRLLHARFDGAAEVVAVAHAGHDGTEAGERVRPGDSGRPLSRAHAG